MSCHRSQEGGKGTNTLIKSFSPNFSKRGFRGWHSFPRGAACSLSWASLTAWDHFLTQVSEASARRDLPKTKKNRTACLLQHSTVKPSERAVSNRWVQRAETTGGSTKSGFKQLAPEQGLLPAGRRCWARAWKDYKTMEHASSRAPLFTAWLSHMRWKTSNWPERWLHLESLLNQHNPYLPVNRKSSRSDQVLLNLLEEPAQKHRSQKPFFSAEEATALAGLLHRELNTDLCAHILTGCCLILSPWTLFPLSLFLFFICLNSQKGK